MYEPLEYLGPHPVVALKEKDSLYDAANMESIHRQRAQLFSTVEPSNGEPEMDGGGGLEGDDSPGHLQQLFRKAIRTPSRRQWGLDGK